MNQWTQERLRRVERRKQWESFVGWIVVVFEAGLVMFVMYLLLGFIYSLF